METKTHIKPNINIHKLLCGNQSYIKKIEKHDPNAKYMLYHLDNDKVLLYGHYKIDCITMKNYESKYKLKNVDTNILQNNKTLRENNILTEFIFDCDKTYNFDDYDLLVKYLRNIQQKISKCNEFDDEYLELMDIRDQVKEKLCDFGIEIDNASLICLDNDEHDLKNDDKNKKNKKSKLKLKPYFWIGTIPEGYREATEAEAIIRRKVGYYGKKCISNKLYNVWKATGTLPSENKQCKLSKLNINSKIIALKGKMLFYQKQKKNINISLECTKISNEKKMELLQKFDDTIECINIIQDVYNHYVDLLNECDDCDSIH